MPWEVCHPPPIWSVLILASFFCPVLNTCCMCSCWAISTLRVHYDKSGGLQISRHRWAVLAKWIHPWQLMNDVLVLILGLISCTVATLLQCIQWIINWHARPLLKVKQFQRRIILCVIPCDMQLLAVVVSVMWGNCQSSSDGDGPRRWRNIYSLQSRFSGYAPNAGKFESPSARNPVARLLQIQLKFILSTIFIKEMRTQHHTGCPSWRGSKCQHQSWEIQLKKVTNPCTNTGGAELPNWRCSSGRCSGATDSCTKVPSIEKWVSIPRLVQ